jgi:dCTP deaminase
LSALSKIDIAKRLDDKTLTVSPLIHTNQLGESSIDLRMGTVVMLARAGAQSHVDPAAYVNRDNTNKHELQRKKQQKHERFDIPFTHPFLLHPGTLALVPTLEWVKIPQDIQGIVTARSSWAREGLNIATATIVNPGYCGIITLELANFGEIPITLYPGLRLAQMAFYEIATPATNIKASQFNGKFEPSAGDIADGDYCFIPEHQKK